MADHFNYGRAALQQDIHTRLARGDDPCEVLAMVVAQHDGNTEMVTDLLNLGGSVEATDNHRLRLVHLAIIWNRVERRAAVLEVLTAELKKQGLPSVPTNSFKVTRRLPK